MSDHFTQTVGSENTCTTYIIIIIKKGEQHVIIKTLFLICFV